MRPRPSTLFLSLHGSALILVALGGIHASRRSDAELSLQRENRALVRKLGITDLCLFTDARYTRHLSLADLHSPFQDHPRSLEHFPSGMLLGPPLHLEMKK